MNKTSHGTRRVGAMLAALIALALPARAGWVFGPYLIWMNLAADSSADDAIHLYTHAEASADSCWNDDALLQYRELPAGITPDLVRKAVVERDPISLKRLLDLLKRGEEGIEGFDGVVVVPIAKKPTLMSLAASGRIVSKVVKQTHGNPDWPTAFCAVLPPISRKP